MSLKKEERNKLILKLKKQGLGYRKIAEIFGVDWSRIRQIVKENV